MASATCSVVIQPGTISSAYGYKAFLRKVPKKYFWLVVPCAIGSLLGAVLLAKTSNTFFGYLAPFFLLFAVVLLVLRQRIQTRLFAHHVRAKLPQRQVLVRTIGLVTIFFVLAIYGGYFGAGFGMVALGLLGLTNIRNINQMNGLKNILGLSIAPTEIAIYMAHHLIDWSIAPPMLVGNVVGGYLGAVYISKLPERMVHMIIVAVGVVVTGMLFAQFYW